MKVPDLGKRQRQIVLDRLPKVGKTTRDLQRDLKVTRAAVTNWWKRGISQGMVIPVAELIRADPTALRRGQYVPKAGIGRPEAHIDDQEAADLIEAYRNLTDAQKFEVWKIIKQRFRDIEPSIQHLMPDLTPERAGQMTRILRRTKDLKSPR